MSPKGFSQVIDRFTVFMRRRDPGRAGKRSLRILFLFAGSLSSSFLCLGSALEEPFPPGVEIRAEAHPEIASVGDPIRVDLAITAPPGYRIEIPEPERRIGDFHILDFVPGPGLPDPAEAGKREPSTTPPDEAARQGKAQVVTAVYKTGKFTFPGIPVYVTNKDGRKTGHRSPPIDIEIKSVLAADDSNLRDLKKQADIPEPVRWLLWTLVAAAACVLGAAAWYIRRRLGNRPVSSQSVSLAQNPFERAESDLRDLIAMQLPENGHAKKFYVLLSEIVKRILEAAYPIPAAERTTIEIMEDLRRQNGLGTENLEAVESLLLQCDIVKFAKYIPSATENGNATGSAFRILSEARQYTLRGQNSHEDVTAPKGRSENGPGCKPGEADRFHTGPIEM